MKIYFAGSIRGGRGDVELYHSIIGLLAKYGTVLTEHVGGKDLSSYGEQHMADEQVYKRDMAWLDEADVVVAEVTNPSLGVGYEIGTTEGRKPVLCLFRPQEGRRLSAMLAGNSLMTVHEYTTLAEVESILADFFQKNFPGKP